MFNVEEVHIEPIPYLNGFLMNNVKKNTKRIWKTRVLEFKTPSLLFQICQYGHKCRSMLKEDQVQI